MTDIKDMEKRLKKLENEVFKYSKNKSSNKGNKTLVNDLDTLMKNKYSKGGIVFSGVAIPSESGDRFVRWSTSGSFENSKEVYEYINQASTEAIFEFCQSFSSKEKLQIIKILLKNESLNQKDIVSLTGITQGKFYHHIKDLLSNKFVKNTDSNYSLTAMGHVLAMSLIGLTNAFVKKTGAE